MGSIFGFVLVGIFFVFVYAAIKDSQEKDSRKKAMEDFFAQRRDGFSASQKLILDYQAIAVDEKNRKLCLLDHRKQELLTRVIPYSDLLSCELFQDGSTLTRTIRTSQIGGALLGGLALGGVGAVIGGLSGKTSSEEEVEALELRLIVNEISSPIFDLHFQSYKTKKTDPMYRSKLETARQWHAILKVVIERADAEDQPSAPSQKTPASAFSVTDEIKKLAELKSSGAISADEYLTLKTKLIGRSD